MSLSLTNSSIQRLKVRPKAFEVSDQKLKGLLVRVQPTGLKTFYFTYRNEEGRRNRIKIGEFGKLSVAQARDIAKSRAVDVYRGQDVQFLRKQGRLEAGERKERTLERFLDDHYQQWVITHKKSGKQTLERIRAGFREFMQIPLEDLGQKIEGWRTGKLNDGLQPSSINRSVSALRASLSKAVDWGIVNKHPLEELKKLPESTSPRVRYLTEEEERRLGALMVERDKELVASRRRGNQHRAIRNQTLLASKDGDTYGDRLSPMVIVSRMTGLRRGELFDIEWQDLDTHSRTLLVRGDISKNGKSRVLPLNETALKCLQTWQQQTNKTQGRIFASDAGGRLVSIKKSFHGLLSKADISDFRWHDMRHDFASRLVMKGVPLNTVRELCGHSDMNTTQIYAHLAPNHKADAVALLED